MFTTFQVFVCLKRSIISTFSLKRISFHFALPSVGLRAEVARRWWLSLWWRDPPWAWFSLITSTERYRDTHTHTQWGTTAIQRSFSRSLCSYLWEAVVTHSLLCWEGLQWSNLMRLREHLGNLSGVKENQMVTMKRPWEQEQLSTSSVHRSNKLWTQSSVYFWSLDERRDLFWVTKTCEIWRTNSPQNI